MYEEVFIEHEHCTFYQAVGPAINDEIKPGEMRRWRLQLTPTAPSSHLYYHWAQFKSGCH